MADEEKPNPHDFKRAMSVGEFKEWTKRHNRELEKILQAFQQDMIQGQVRLNLAWNALNAIVRSFVVKGLITEQDIREAGEQLMKEAQLNLEKAKVAVAEGRPMAVGEATQVPLERVRDILFPKKS